MERIVNFGDFTAKQQLKILEKKLKSEDVLLFQFYERNTNSIESQKYINEYFENYCDDIIHYYNPKVQLEINKAVLNELKKNVEFLGETNEKIKEKKIKDLFIQMKGGDFTNISEKSIESIKKIVYFYIVKYNTNNQLNNYVAERLHGKSQWILDDRGKIYDEDGAIWFKPQNKDEYLDVLKRFPLFSCIILKNGENINNFSFGYVVQETATNYDLLVFKNKV